MDEKIVSRALLLLWKSIAFAFLSEDNFYISSLSSFISSITMIAFLDPWKVFAFLLVMVYPQCCITTNQNTPCQRRADEIPRTAPKLRFAEDLHSMKIFARTKVEKKKQSGACNASPIPRRWSYLHLLLEKWTNTFPSLPIFFTFFAFKERTPFHDFEWSTLKYMLFLYVDLVP